MPCSFIREWLTDLIMKFLFTVDQTTFLSTYLKHNNCKMLDYLLFFPRVRFFTHHLHDFCCAVGPLSAGSATPDSIPDRKYLKNRIESVRKVHALFLSLFPVNNSYLQSTWIVLAIISNLETMQCVEEDLHSRIRANTICLIPQILVSRGVMEPVLKDTKGWLYLHGTLFPKGTFHLSSHWEHSNKGKHGVKSWFWYASRRFS